jgi:galactokinase
MLPSTTGPPAEARVRRTFRAVFGAPPRAVSAAPGRVNLIGEHTDYNDGFVLPMAIEPTTVCAGDVTTDGCVHVITSAATTPVTFDLGAALTRGQPAWSNYVRGVVAGFQRRGTRLTGLRMAIDSDVPRGGGLSSSAALEVSVAMTIAALAEASIDPMETVHLCRQAEHEFAGVPCGIMDQSIVVLARAGHALRLDCRSAGATYVAMTDPSVSVLIINTHVRHSLAAGEYARRRAQCEAAARALGVPALRDATPAALEACAGALDPVLVRRARHVISENARTLEACEALRTGAWPRMGTLMSASHASLRDDFEVSCAELDAAVAIASGLGEAGGVFGARMTGGGFGGCVVALVRAEAAEAVSAHVADRYRCATGRTATIFTSRAAGGARVIR